MGSRRRPDRPSTGVGFVRSAIIPGRVVEVLAVEDPDSRLLPELLQLLSVEAFLPEGDAAFGQCPVNQNRPTEFCEFSVEVGEMPARADDVYLSVGFKAGHKGFEEPSAHFFPLCRGCRVFLVEDIVADDEVIMAADDCAARSCCGNRRFLRNERAFQFNLGFSPAFSPSVAPDPADFGAVDVRRNLPQECFGLLERVGDDEDALIRVSQDFPEDEKDIRNGGFAVAARGEQDGFRVFVLMHEPPVMEVLKLNTEQDVGEGVTLVRNDCVSERARSPVRFRQKGTG